MGKSKWLPLVWITLLTSVILSAFVLLERGPYYFGEQYFTSDQFQHEYNSFIQQAGPALLNPLDPDEAKKQITVSKQEIEDHRNHYGTLADQIENIQYQYMDRIANADGNETVKAALIKERDAKITDIEKNFSDDEHVAAKIRLEKEAVIDNYMNELRRLREEISSSYGYFAYQLENVHTGEKYERGNFNHIVFKKEYNAEEGYLNVKSLIDSSTGFEVAEMVGNQSQQFSGAVAVMKSAVDSMAYSQQYKDFTYKKTTIYVFSVIGLIALLLLLFKVKFDRQWFTGKLSNWYNSLRIDMKILLFVVNGIAAYIAMLNAIEFFFYYYLRHNWLLLIISLMIAVALVGALVFQIVNLFEKYRDTTALVEDFRSSYLIRLAGSTQDLFLNRSIGLQTLFLYGIAFAAGFGFLVVLMIPSAILIYIPLFLFIALPAILYLLSRAGYLNRIMKTAEEMAQGKLNKEIEVRGKSPLAHHAANLNRLREGVQSSISEQAKSERLKTELITNVSHDLRTPLTSIITYTDLLKNPDLPTEERDKYIEILDRKSQRLKTLIEDLFEVSKMASGNIELHKQRVDLTQLLHQALAEHEEEIAKSALKFRISIPEPPMVAYVDGQKWWRVLDNLIVNSVKYALDGTRVYVTLREVGNEAEFIVKNITKYEIGENVEELFERFKRADTSRHTDGSGLGLAIAQSIVDLHGGRMKIDVDGDLFKVTVTVPIV